MFKVKSVKAVKKDLKKLPHEVMKDIEAVHFQNVRENPFQGYELVTKSHHEHLIIYLNSDMSRNAWQWVKRKEKTESHHNCNRNDKQVYNMYGYITTESKGLLSKMPL